MRVRAETCSGCWDPGSSLSLKVEVVDVRPGLARPVSVGIQSKRKAPWGQSSEFLREMKWRS